MWTMVVCQSFFLGICNSYVIVDYPTEQRCTQAVQDYLKHSKDKPATIFCRPKHPQVKA